MTTAKAKAQAVWAELNERQQTWLLVIYQADQEAEASAAAAWHSGDRTVPASVWRWIEYGWTHSRLALSSGPDGLLQERLNARKVWDQGAGSTMTVLTDRKLIQTKLEPGLLSDHLFIKLTPSGRAAARAGGGDDTAPARKRPKGLLGETLWTMLVEAHGAGENGLRRRSVSTGWEALADQGLISIDRGSYPNPLVVTPVGREHYRTHWAEYARLYPGVNARNPDGQAAWPVDVDQHLTGLGNLVHAIVSELSAVDEQLRTLTDPPATPKTAPAEEVALGRMRRERHKVELRLQELLGQQQPKLIGLYRQAVARYVAVACAVVAAAVAGEDPHTVLDTEPAALDELGLAPDIPCPTTGLDGVDREIREARRAAVSGPKRARRRTDREFEERHQPAGPNVAAVLRYADHLRRLVEKGYLTRLLLRLPTDPTGTAPGHSTG